MAKPDVWILTQEFNDYDQHGAYFVAAFDGKPTIARMAEVLDMRGAEHDTTFNVMAAVALIEHILQGGGRRGVENNWYRLEKVDLK